MVRMKMVSARQPTSTGWLLWAAVLAIGCAENPKAQFSWRESTQGLLPAGRLAVQNTIRDNFGTPDELVAWGRMPVDYSAATGTVTAAPDGVTLAEGQLAATLSGDAAAAQPGAKLHWLSGANATAAATTAELSAVTPSGEVHLLTVGGTAAEGDTFAVNFGSQLQLGRMVYMKNCLHCHGVAGDGQGPTARYLNPKPRDYRLGIFKFTETLATERVTRHDLWRVIKYGIPGTYMPSFLLLDDGETKAVVEYVRWLAMRGEMEKRLADELIDYSTEAVDDSFKKAQTAYDAARAAGEKAEKPNRSAILGDVKQELTEYLKSDYADAVDSTADIIAELWTRAEDPASVITPSVARVADTPASRANGRLLYMSDKTKCYTCHGATGRGNGGTTEDFWPKPGSTEKYAERGLHDTWGNKLPPRNLRLGQYRGGRRPVDVFRRIYAGIKGTPMPAFGGSVLKDEEIWDIVNYVMSLPYEDGASPAAAPAPQVAARPTP
jgi:mono/diheme cytochrome c family protein